MGGTYDPVLVISAFGIPFVIVSFLLKAYTNLSASPLLAIASLVGVISVVVLYVVFNVKRK